MPPVIPLKAGADPTSVPVLERIHYIDYATDGGAAQKAAQEKLPGQLSALDAAGGGAPPPGAWPSPFPGLASFDGDRAWAFCGRRAETNDLAELMRSPATAAAEELVVVVGPPGCGCRVRVVATLRSELVPALQESTRLREVPVNLFTLRPVPDTLREVIVEPARRARITIAPGPVDALVRDTPDGNAPPLLAHAPSRLADGVGAGGELSRQRYDAMGGVVGALVGLADAAPAARREDGRTPDEVLTGLLQPVTFDQDGRPTGKHLDGGGPPAEVSADLEAFVNKHLLTTRAEGGRARILAVRHQSFLTAWPPLSKKIEEEKGALRQRDALVGAARAWGQAGRVRTGLWDAGRIARATKPGPSGVVQPPSEVEREFVAASRRRRVIRWGAVIAVPAATLVVVLLLTAPTTWQWRQARHERAVAQQEKERAIARELPAPAAGMLESDPRPAIQPARAAYDVTGTDSLRPADTGSR